jgi:DNA-binding response OmpR family regulator
MAAFGNRLDLRKTKALVVDDNPQSLELLSQIMSGFRMGKLRSCQSASEARSLVARESFDLILIDFAMPDEDGLNLARHIRSESSLPNQTVPILILHGYTPEHMVFQARDAGANLIVKKPVAPAVLLSRIQWVARDSRQFVDSESYTGPDRRIKTIPQSPGRPERRLDALALVNDPERAMSQDDISELFG